MVSTSFLHSFPERDSLAQEHPIVPVVRKKGEVTEKFPNVNGSRAIVGHDMFPTSRVKTPKNEQINLRSPPARLTDDSSDYRVLSHPPNCSSHSVSLSLFVFYLNLVWFHGRARFFRQLSVKLLYNTITSAKQKQKKRKIFFCVLWRDSKMENSNFM